MSALTVNHVVDAGTAGAGVAPTASDTVDVGNGRNTFLIYRNTADADLVLTVVVPGDTDYGQANPDPSITVAATTGEVWIPIRREYAALDGTNIATITATGVDTGQTVQAVRVDFA